MDKSLFSLSTFLSQICALLSKACYEQHGRQNKDSVLSLYFRFAEQAQSRFHIFKSFICYNKTFIYSHSFMYVHSSIHLLGFRLTFKDRRLLQIVRHEDYILFV